LRGGGYFEEACRIASGKERKKDKDDKKSKRTLKKREGKKK